jgi:hypothetical protein
MLSIFVHHPLIPKKMTRPLIENVPPCSYRGGGGGGGGGGDIDSLSFRSIPHAWRGGAFSAVMYLHSPVRVSTIRPKSSFEEEPCQTTKKSPARHTRALSQLDCVSFCENLNLGSSLPSKTGFQPGRKESLGAWSEASGAGINGIVVGVGSGLEQESSAAQNRKKRIGTSLSIYERITKSLLLW